MALRSSSVAGLCREIELIWWRSRGDWNRTPVRFRLRVFILCFNKAGTVVPTFQFIEENRQSWDAVGRATTLGNYKIKNWNLPLPQCKVLARTNDIETFLEESNADAGQIDGWTRVDVEWNAKGDQQYERVWREDRETRKIRRNESERTMYSLSLRIYIILVLLNFS